MTEADKEWDMEREEKQKAINALKISAPVMAVTQEEFNDYIQTLNQVMDWLEQDPCEDEYIKVPKKALKYVTKGIVAYNYEWLKNHFDIERAVICGAQEPKIGHCKDCRWWKDSDGAYRRGINAESQCPMNRIEVYEGNGYCFMFEPQKVRNE